ncbi:hypothetical protein LTR10_019880 [Elasticomyces elasticus]|nr:hypothetical protein LTR10_019880 [Elasticomyces elasticus]
MSDRQRRHSHDTYIYDDSREPILIEREPQVRKRDRIVHPPPQKLTLGSKLYNLFKLRRKRVSIIEETPVRSRHRERHIRTLSASPSPPPPPHRGPYQIMSPRPGQGDIFVPLPPELPPRHREDKVLVNGKEYRKVKIHKNDRHHHDPHDEDAHPVVLMNGYHRHRDEPDHVRIREPDLRDDLLRHERRERREAEERAERERRRRHEAERAAARAQAEAEAEQERRYREVQRERRDRERRERDRDARDRAHGVVVRDPRDVVVVHRRNTSDALDRAREDFQHIQRREMAEDQLRGRVERQE